MDARAGKRETLSFSFRVVLPVVLAVCITGATVASFVLWATARSDDRAIQREAHLASQVIAREMRTLAEVQDEHSNWDEAVEAIADGDLGWIDGNLAEDLFSAGGFDRIYVLDHSETPLYASNGGGRTTTVRFEPDRGIVASMVGRLKEINAAGALAAYDAGHRDTVPAVAETAIVDGRPAYVGVSAIMSESATAGLRQEPGNESFLVAIRFLDNALVQQFAEVYVFTDPRFTQDASATGDRVSLALASASGETVGWFSWVPDRPGAQILSETLPAMLGALVMVGLVLVYLLRSLLRTTSALETGRAEAEHRANHDPLTGLANRAHFNQQLEAALSATGMGGTSVALLALDLDRFKQVNDTLGHEAGDELLQEVARRIRPLVADHDTVARLGGDEFAIIQRGVRSLDQVSALSSRIIGAVGTPFVVTGRVAEIGVSIGVVIAPAAQAPRDLASKADVALYAAKAAGRNTFRIFDEELAAGPDRADALPGGVQVADTQVAALEGTRRAA